MAYNLKVAERVREYLAQFKGKNIEEKSMFAGLAFMVNDKMCINVSGDNLMCRFDSKKTEEVSSKMGYQPMVMKGKEYKGYCYVTPEGFQTKQDFEYWLNLCLSFNNQAVSSKK
jgi:TfoX/Sxy family transcriptional regulator of competence genes